MLGADHSTRSETDRLRIDPVDAEILECQGHAYDIDNRIDRAYFVKMNVLYLDTVYPPLSDRYCPKDVDAPSADSLRQLTRIYRLCNLSEGDVMMVVRVTFTGSEFEVRP